MTMCQFIFCIPTNCAQKLKFDSFLHHSLFSYTPDFLDEAVT